MASLVWDRGAGGRRARILFLVSDRRKAIRLGKVPSKVADEWKRRVEELVANLVGGVAADASLAAWLRDLPDEAHERLTRVGLVAPRVREEVHTLEQLLTDFTDCNAGLKPATVANYAQTLDSLRDFYGPDRPLSMITRKSADEWKKAITTAPQGEGRRKKKRLSPNGKLAPATVSKRVKVAKQLFAKGVSWGWLDVSPFEDLTAGSQANPSRAFYVDEKTTESVLVACPGSEWRALVGLCRYAGLRCPSEVGELTWADIDWNSGRLTVRSPKTEHYGHDHAVRLVPISPRLRVILTDAFDAAPDRQSLVVPVASRKTANLRTAFERIIVRASCQPWPRLFQNLRASCETDWATRYPAHAVAKWLGHSPRIAQAHYLVTTDAHFQAVIEHRPDAGERGANSGAATGLKQYRNDSQVERETKVIPAESAISPRSNAKVVESLVGPVWPEQPTFCSGKPVVLPHGGARCGAPDQKSDLAEVINAWASLSAADRAAIMLRVRAAVDMLTTDPPS
jgi:integrase